MPYTKKENALSDEQQNIFRKLHDTENLLDKPNVMVKNIFFKVFVFRYLINFFALIYSYPTRP